jgi:glutamate dehydrogenase (NAD(P)+)
LPDVLCNAGGVIVSYFEWVQDLQQLFWEENEVFERLERILDRSFDRVMARASSDHVSHRTASLAIGIEKVHAAKKMRGLFP